MCWTGDKLCVALLRVTFSLSSRLIARASCSCSSSSPVEEGIACSRSGASREEEATGTERAQRCKFRGRIGSNRVEGGKKENKKTFYVDLFF